MMHYHEFFAIKLRKVMGHNREPQSMCGKIWSQAIRHNNLRHNLYEVWCSYT